MGLLVEESISYWASAGPLPIILRSFNPELVPKSGGRQLNRLVAVSILVTALFAGFASPAHAAARVIAQKTAKSPKAVLVLPTVALNPHHAYRVEVVASGRAHVSALALEDYIYVVAGRLGNLTKTRKLRGTAPVSSRFAPPLSKGLRAWGMEVQVQPSGKAVFTVRVVDLGKSK